MKYPQNDQRRFSVSVCISWSANCGRRLSAFSLWPTAVHWLSDVSKSSNTKSCVQVLKDILIFPGWFWLRLNTLIKALAEKKVKMEKNIKLKSLLGSLWHIGDRFVSLSSAVHGVCCHSLYLRTFLCTCVWLCCSLCGLLLYVQIGKNCTSFFPS